MSRYGPKQSRTGLIAVYNQHGVKKDAYRYPSICKRNERIARWKQEYGWRWASYSLAITPDIELPLAPAEKRLAEWAKRSEKHKSRVHRYTTVAAKSRETRLPARGTFFPTQPLQGVGDAPNSKELTTAETL